MRVLIVGSEGTVGRAAAGELAKRHEVVSAGRKSGALDRVIEHFKRSTHHTSHSA